MLSYPSDSQLDIGRRLNRLGGCVATDVQATLRCEPDIELPLSTQCASAGLPPFVVCPLLCGAKKLDVNQPGKSYT
jgi:hypothetical protein